MPFEKLPHNPVLLVLKFYMYPLQLEKYMCCGTHKEMWFFSSRLSRLISSLPQKDGKEDFFVTWEMKKQNL